VAQETNGSSASAQKSTPATAHGKSGHEKLDSEISKISGSLPSGINFSFLEEHAKVFVALAVVVILGTMGYLGFDYLKNRQEKQAQTAFYSVESNFSKVKEGFERAKYQKSTPTPKVATGEKAADKAGEKPGAEPAKEASGNIDQDYGTLLADLEKVARDHAGTAGGAQAALLAVETLLSYNQAEKAVTLAEFAAKSLSANKILGALLRIQWGTALAAKNDCAAAVGIWQQVLSSPQVAFLHGEASLRAGICFESTGQNDKALEMFRKASADGSNSGGGTAAGGGESSSGTARAAKGFLRTLEIKLKSSQG
jgi:predicted negative regulator of RcsB-dependent stress response